MMCRVLTALAVLIVALCLALGSAWWMVMRGGSAHVTTVGVWRMSTAAGSMDADLYTRARVAVTGLFALNASETIYFEAARDDAGQPLRAACQYAVAGRPPGARWWSITAYADDFFLIPNPENRFSYNMENMASAVDGTFRLSVGPTPRSGNWLPSGTHGGVRLLLRLYNPAPDLLAHPEAALLPSITAIGDCP